MYAVGLGKLSNSFEAFSPLSGNLLIKKVASFLLKENVEPNFKRPRRRRFQIRNCLHESDHQDLAENVESPDAISKL